MCEPNEHHHTLYMHTYRAPPLTMARVQRKQVAPKRLAPRDPRSSQPPLVFRQNGLDLAQVAECVREFKAFARGGLPGVSVLARVWKNVLKRYGVDTAYAKYALTQADLALTRDGGLRLINAPLIPECDLDA